MPVITTSRSPGKETRKLARETAKKFGLLYFNRNQKTVFEAAEKARYEGKKLIIIVNELLGKPKELQIVEVNKNGFSYSKKFGSLSELEVFLEKAVE